MKAQILREMKVLKAIEPEFEVQRRVAFIKTKLKEASSKALVLGISGGVDSSTAGRLCQLAVDSLNSEHPEGGYQFIAVRLPYQIQKDEHELHRLQRIDTAHLRECRQPFERLACIGRAGLRQLLNAYAAQPRDLRSNARALAAAIRWVRACLAEPWPRPCWAFSLCRCSM